MSLNIATYVRKPFEIKAVEVTAQNIEEVAAWCEGEVRTSAKNGRYIKVAVRRALNDRQTRAHIGDFVLSAGTGFKVYTPKAFHESFDEVQDGSSSQTEELFVEPDLVSTN